jgi:hypothetical protein
MIAGSDVSNPSVHWEQTPRGNLAGSNQLTRMPRTAREESPSLQAISPRRDNPEGISGTIFLYPIPADARAPMSSTRFFRS